MTVKENDVLFRSTRFAGLAKVRVIKITPKGNIRLSDGSLLSPDLRKKTSDSFDDTRYYKWSQELEDKYRLQMSKQNLYSKLKSLDVENLDAEAVDILLDALNKIQKVEEQRMQ